jgi:hypothetical protein
MTDCSELLLHSLSDLKKFTLKSFKAKTVGSEETVIQTAGRSNLINSI